MKSLTLVATFVALTATFAVPGYASDDLGIKPEAPAIITFINQQTTKSPRISNAVYVTDVTDRKQNDLNLLVEVNGKHFKKKFLKKRSFRRGFSDHRRFGSSHFGHRGFGHRGFSHRGYDHRNFGHGGFRQHRSDFGHHRFGDHGHEHNLGEKLIKKGLIGKLFFGY